jgi:hypothetical protein
LRFCRLRSLAEKLKHTLGVAVDYHEIGAHTPNTPEDVAAAAVCRDHGREDAFGRLISCFGSPFIARPGLGANPSGPLATTHLHGRVMTDYDNTKKLSGIPALAGAFTHMALPA